jgi:hypothetical protein
MRNKLKLALGISLLSSLFSVGNILFFGLSKPGQASDFSFSLGYFSMCLLFLLLILGLARDFFTGSGDLAFLAFFGLLVCVALSFTAFNLREVQVANLPDSAGQMQNEIHLLAAGNKAYQEFIPELARQLENQRNITNYLREKLGAGGNQPIPPSTTTAPTTSTTIPTTITTSTLPSTSTTTTIRFQEDD